jgi:hypothetical protein
LPSVGSLSFRKSFDGYRSPAASHSASVEAVSHEAPQLNQAIEYAEEYIKIMQDLNPMFLKLKKRIGNSRYQKLWDKSLDPMRSASYAGDVAIVAADMKEFPSEVSKISELMQRLDEIDQAMAAFKIEDSPELLTVSRELHQDVDSRNLNNSELVSYNVAYVSALEAKMKQGNLSAAKIWILANWGGEINLGSFDDKATDPVTILEPTLAAQRKFMRNFAERYKVQETLLPMTERTLTTEHFVNGMRSRLHEANSGPNH